MTLIAKKRRFTRIRRHHRIRRKLSGTPEVPRLAVYRSLSHIYAQIVDDSAGRSLVSTSTLDPSLKEALAGKKKREKARLVGQRVAELAKARGIETVAFDRGGYLYHGRIRELAEGARAGGLKF